MNRKTVTFRINQNLTENIEDPHNFGSRLARYLYDIKVGKTPQPTNISFQQLLMVQVIQKPSLLGDIYTVSAPMELWELAKKSLIMG